MILARVTYDGGGAYLDDTLTWSASEPAVADALNGLVRAEDASPARGDWPRAHARRVARLLGGTAEFPDRPPPHPGRVY